MLGTEVNVDVEVERQPEAEEMEIVPSWGTGRQVWGTGTVMAVITISERGTGIELRGGSELRPNLLKICAKREREIIIQPNNHRNQKKNVKNMHAQCWKNFVKLFLEPMD